MARRVRQLIQFTSFTISTAELLTYTSHCIRVEPPASATTTRTHQIKVGVGYLFKGVETPIYHITAFLKQYQRTNLALNI